MRLVRSNDDPKLIADLERLAGKADAPVPASSEVVAADVERLAAVGGSAPPEALIEDAFVRRFVKASVHVKKYVPFYVGGGLWLLVMLLVQPLGRGSDAPSSEVAGSRSAVAASTSGRVAATPPDADTAGAPVFDSFGGSSFGSDDTTAFSDFSDPAPAETFDTSSSESEFTFDDSSESFDSEEFETFEDEPEVPDPLSVLESGYASSAAGTPLEQPPAGGGLPITIAAGTMTKYSFLRLAGDETTLSLQESQSDNVNSGTAALKMCPLTTSDWKGSPGQKMADAPKYDTGYCASGTRGSTGLWTFDLSGLAPIEGSNGFAIIPGPGTASTFQVVFKPTAVEPEPAAE